MQGTDYRQKLLDETAGLSDREREKLYRIITVIRHEPLEEDDEARYRTPSWMAAEREATEAYRQGRPERFQSVREMAEHIEGQIPSQGPA
jgi:hypothetical protein